MWLRGWRRWRFRLLGLRGRRGLLATAQDGKEQAEDNKQRKDSARKLTYQALSPLHKVVCHHFDALELRAVGAIHGKAGAYRVPVKTNNCGAGL